MFYLMSCSTFVGAVSTVSFHAHGTQGARNNAGRPGDVFSP